MKVADAIVEILKREGVEMMIGYPMNHILEFCARGGIRPIIVRQERVGLHMADAISRLTSGKKIGVFGMQHGPGAENAFGGVAQAFAESSPILVLPMGFAWRQAYVEPNFSSATSMKGITKHAVPVTSGEEIPNVFRRAFARLRNGRGAPVLVEVPNDLWTQDVPEPLDYEPAFTAKYTPAAEDIKKAAKMMVEAKRLVLYAAQGVHYAQAWDELKELAEHLAVPVCTSLPGKSAFPEDHPLALGSGGGAMPKAVRFFLDESDVILGIGASFTETSFNVNMPKGKRIIQQTLDPEHLNKDIKAVMGLVGDAKLTLRALIDEIKLLVPKARDPKAIHKEIADVRDAWLKEWMPKLTSDEVPMTPYRVIWDLMHTVDVANTIITHDSGNPRDQLSPFWVTKTPLSYIGWGKTTQLGTGLGFAMGAKLACPDKLCINVWGDAAIGFTGMDFETAVRERIPILSILFNNFCMAAELDVMPVSTEKYRATDISGDYAAMARAFGGYGERITTPDQIIPAIKRGIEQTRQGRASLLEFITCKETARSRYRPKKQVL
jgi:acetolactate synthase-1/2/3 large subunit